MNIHITAFALFAFLNSGFAATELARINNQVISLEEFNQVYQKLTPMLSGANTTKQKILDDYIFRKIGVLEAKKKNLEQDPEVMQEMDTVLYSAFIKKELQPEVSKIQMSDSDLKSWYSSNPDIRTSQIFIGIAPGSNKATEDDAYSRMRVIEDLLKKPGASFPAIAQKYSEAVTATQGGDLDYQSKDKLESSYYDSALKLRTPGKVSGIVRTQFGLHLIKLTAIRDYKDADKAQIRQLAENEKKQVLFDKLKSKLRSQYNISIKSGLL